MRRALIILFLLLVVAPVVFYSSFELAAKNITAEHELQAGAMNCVKHSYATATLYKSFLTLGLSEDKARDAVLFLGIANEKLEGIFKRGGPDSSSELVKDLYNNWGGIVIAKWQRAHDDQSLDDIIAAMVKRQLLVVSAAEVNISPAFPAGKELEYAQAWLNANRDVIEGRITSSLESEAP